MKDYDEIRSCQFLAKVIVRDDYWYKFKNTEFINVVYEVVFDSFEAAEQAAIGMAKSIRVDEGLRIFAEIELLIKYKNETDPTVRHLAFYEL